MPGIPRPRGRGLIEATSPFTLIRIAIEFRDPAVAASLKRVRHLRGGAEARPIPRPRGRGLIEARSSVGRYANTTSIPRPRGRGLIEAQRWAPTFRISP